MKMKNNIYIDDSTADRIVCCSLKESIKCLKKNIKEAKQKKKLENHEKQQLSNDIIQLDAMEKVFDYYGGNYYR
jgi:hypothetical protein